MKQYQQKSEHECLEMNFRAFLENNKNSIITNTPENKPSVLAKAFMANQIFLLISSTQNKPNTQLTDRQSQIVELVCDGLPNKIIADRLGIKTSTVAAILNKIFCKLQVKSRTELARLKFYGPSGNILACQQ